MILKQLLNSMKPAFLIKTIRRWRDSKKLRSIPRDKFNTRALRHIRDVNLKELFDSREVEFMWNDSREGIDGFAIPDGTGGVNPGDRKAIFYLISKFQPSSVLEIGSLIGASTIHIASALFESQIKIGGAANLISVDIMDVNDHVSKPWLQYGMKHPPDEMVNLLGFASFVEFFNDSSLNYFTRCERKFDFIFLDGDHSEQAVYQEIPAALNHLQPNGVILLHDYFPDQKPLWLNGSVKPGPYLATERLKNEGANFVVLPLNELPWPTKLQSNITSLALLLRND